MPSFASPPPPSSSQGTFLKYTQDSRDSDPYDDGTDIIEMPSFAASPSPRRYSSEPILIEDADLEPDVEEIDSGLIQYTEVGTIHPSDPEIEDEPDSLLSELDPDDDDDIEDERQSLLSDDLEPEGGGLVGHPELTAASARNAASVIERRAREALLEELEHQVRAGVEVEADESEDEPTHKLRVDAVARRAAQRSSAAAAAARGRAAPSERPSDPPASLADELEPDADDDPTQKDADAGHPPATRRSERPQGGIDWDDAPPSGAPAAAPPTSAQPNARSSVPASVPPRRSGARASGNAAVPRPSATQRASQGAGRRTSPAVVSRPPAASRISSGAQALASDATSRSAPRAAASTRKSSVTKNGVTSKQPAAGPGAPSTPSAAQPAPSETPAAAPEFPEVRPAEAAPAAFTRDSIDSISELPTTPLLLGVALDTVRGLQDLPEESQLALAKGATVETLNTEEELNGFAVALVLKGKVGIMPAIADVACAEAGVSEVVFTEGHLAEGVMLRVVASVDDTKVAYWDRALLDAQIADCPWVADDLKSIADRFQALAGASMGSLGDRLDAALRGMVTDRCEVIRLEPSEALLQAGQTVNGMYVVGAGHIDLVGPDGPGGTLNPGDFLFPAQVMGGGGAPYTARAGGGGALLLRAERMAALELLVSVPPLLEILAS